MKIICISLFLGGRVLFASIAAGRIIGYNFSHCIVDRETSKRYRQDANCEETMKFYSITPNDLRANVYVLTKEIMDKFKCPDCWVVNTVDVIKSEKLGHDPLPVRLPDFFNSSDRVNIVSKKAKEVITAYDESLAQFYPLAKNPDYFALLPSRLIYPSSNIRVAGGFDFAGVPFRTRNNKCQKCGCYQEVCIKRELLTVPEDVVFAGVVLGPYVSALIGSESFIQHLKKAKMKGFSFSSDFPNK